MSQLERRRGEVSASLAEARLTLKLAMAGAGTDDEFHAGLSKTVHELLGQLESEVSQEPSSVQQLDGLATQIHRCEAKRAYWLDAAHIQTEADSCIRELRAWGVPQLYLNEHLQPLHAGVRAALAEAAATEKPAIRWAALRRAQATLEAIFLEYNYWDSYTDEYVQRVLWWRLALLGVPGVACLVLSLLAAFAWGRSILAVGLAGLAGTCASIVLRQEPMALYGDSIKSWIWAAGRVMTGLVATVIGIGLLASGLISVGFSQDTNGDAQGLVPLHAVVRACLDFEDQPPMVSSSTPADAGAPDALPVRGQSGVDAGEPARAAQTTPAVADRPCPKTRPCGNGAMLLVLGFAMLFGFSERAFVKLLGQFEERLGNGNDHGSTPPSSSTTVPSGTATQPKDGEPPATSEPSSTAPAQGAGPVVTPALGKGPAAALPQPAATLPPAQPLPRIPTSPGLPAPAAGAPAAKPTKPPGT